VPHAPALTVVRDTVGYHGISREAILNNRNPQGI
jgi:hypothetical protein